MSKKDKTIQYAKALAEVVAERQKSGKKTSDEKIVSNFLSLLTSAGYEGKSKDILDLAETFILAKTGKRKITFETARKMTAGQKKIMESFVAKGDIIKEKINPELIAGIKIIINDSQQFDASMQNKLQNIFK